MLMLDQMDQMLRRPIGQSGRCPERQKKCGERRDPFWAAVRLIVVQWVRLKR